MTSKPTPVLNFFFFFGGGWGGYSCFTMLCKFLLYNKVYRLYVYIQPLPIRPPSLPPIPPIKAITEHGSALCSAPCAIQQDPTSHLFYTRQCTCINPNLPVHFPLLPSMSTRPFSTSASLFCPANTFICTIFLDSTYIH